MLTSLKIENIAIIESAEINLTAGFNVLTGETGAGKSIIIDSLNAVLGERTSRDLIRTSADRASVVAEFSEIPAALRTELQDSGVELDEGNLVISRVMHSDGRNTCRINGAPATVGMLKSCGSHLVNIHGQHDSQALLQPEKHCGFIDSAADNLSLRLKYKEAFSSLISVKRKLEGLYEDENEKASRLEYLNYCIDEIENAAIKVGERDSLNRHKEVCRNSAKVIKAYQNALTAISGEGENDGALSLLLDCTDALEVAATYSEDAGAMLESAKDIGYRLSELSSGIRALADAFDFSPALLNEIDERLDVIYRITHKYGVNEETVFSALESMRSEREAIVSSDKLISELESELNVAGETVKRLAAELTSSRKKAASLFEKRVSSELEFLDMPNVRFVVSVTETSFSSKGADNVEFLISANPGEEPKPLAKIASGGELSRIMLAIKNVVSAEEDTPTLIFDEIDSGVSGRAAQKIGMKIKEVAQTRQVICVTHLAQIAAQGTNHLRITKSVEKGKTFTHIEKLDFENRKRELARITGGLEITEIQLKNAEEMLLSAGNGKDS